MHVNAIKVLLGSTVGLVFITVSTQTICAAGFASYWLLHSLGCVDVSVLCWLWQLGTQ
jgi:hypothetical protein